jgi:small nuclear ribonucleoprotein (snRNP)-like protein
MNCVLNSHLTSPYLITLFPFSLTEVVFVVTGDGRIIVGTLAGHDQVQNLILNEAHERVYSTDGPVEQVPLGLYVIRGDNLCLVGEFEASKFDDEQRVPFPLPSVQHQQF